MFTYYKNIWVFAEARDGKLMNVALELLGEFSKLSEKYGDLKEEDFTEEQKKKIEELMKKFE